jgi:two-component system response regulator FixJ
MEWDWAWPSVGPWFKHTGVGYGLNLMPTREPLSFLPYQRPMSSNSKPTVFLVDDDKAVRDSMRVLLKSAGIPLVSFGSAEEFLENVPENPVGCLLLDVRLPGVSGLDLLDQLEQRNIGMPVILLTEHAEVPMAVRAMRSGAYDFLEKPFKDKPLLDKLRQALGLGEKWQQTRDERSMVAKRLAKLTPREREVLEHLVAGEKNRAIAETLGISRKTLDIHRAKVMSKMEARTTADLVRWFYLDNPREVPTTSLARV